MSLETPRQNYKGFAQSDSFVVPDVSLFSNIVHDVIDGAFQAVGLRDISTAMEKEASSTKPFKLKCSHKYHSQVQHLMCCFFFARKNTVIFMCTFQKSVLYKE